MTKLLWGILQMTTAEPRRSSPQDLPFQMLLAFYPARSVRANLHLLPPQASAEICASASLIARP